MPTPERSTDDPDAERAPSLLDVGVTLLAVALPLAALYLDGVIGGGELVFALGALVGGAAAYLRW